MKIAIDCGHGSNTAGKRTAPFNKSVDINGDGKIDVKKGEQYREHYANVMVANYLYAEFVRQGFKVYKSAWDDSNGKDDSDIGLSIRQANIKAAKCDYSVSIHFNACGDGKSFNNGEGIETLIHSTASYVGDSLKLANKVQSYMIQGTKQKNRGVKSQQLAMCNCYHLGTKASILVELGFMTNEHEAQDMMANSKFCKECAVEICKGFCDYLGVKYIAYFVPEKEFTKASATTQEVMWLQSKLNVDVDGSWGPITAKAVQKKRESFGWKIGDGYKCTEKMIKKLK